MTGSGPNRSPGYPPWISKYLEQSHLGSSDLRHFDLVLARSRPDCADYGYERLLTAEPREIRPIVQALAGRLADLPSRLAKDLASVPVEEPAAAESRDRRRAVAAYGLIVLGRGDLGWPLLRFSPDPQARSFLIHLLGPAGVDPRALVNRLRADLEPSIRFALILSLGEIPDSAWSSELRASVAALLLEIYERDPDPGVHGASKWLLRRWGLDAPLTKYNNRARLNPPRPTAGWRVSPMGLTLVRFEDPATGRIIEIADTETAVELFTQFRPAHIIVATASLGPDYPVTNLNYVLAAEFCNWLSNHEGIAPEQYAFRKGGVISIEPVEGFLDRSGYRLPTTEEFELVCRAGTITPRYHGTTTTLLLQYARYGSPRDLTLYRCGTLKPNDIGLFDLLGNANELCQGPRGVAGANNQAFFCGGSMLSADFDLRSNAKFGPMSVNQTSSLHSFGARVVRTVHPRPKRKQ